MGIFDFLKKPKSDVEQYYEERSRRERDASPVNDTYGETAYTGFRLTVEDVFSITGRGTVVTGRVAAGSVAVGDTVTLRRADGTARQIVVTGVEKFRKMCNWAVEGDNVGLLLRGLERSEVSRGDVLEK